MLFINLISLHQKFLYFYDLHRIRGKLYTHPLHFYLKNNFFQPIFKVRTKYLLILTKEIHIHSQESQPFIKILTIQVHLGVKRATLSLDFPSQQSCQLYEYILQAHQEDHTGQFNQFQEYLNLELLHLYKAKFLQRHQKTRKKWQFFFIIFIFHEYILRINRHNSSIQHDI